MPAQHLDLVARLPPLGQSGLHLLQRRRWARWPLPFAAATAAATAATTAATIAANAAANAAATTATAASASSTGVCAATAARGGGGIAGARRSSRLSSARPERTQHPERAEASGGRNAPPRPSRLDGGSLDDGGCRRAAVAVGFAPRGWRGVHGRRLTRSRSRREERGGGSARGLRSEERVARVEDRVEEELQSLAPRSHHRRVQAVGEAAAEVGQLERKARIREQALTQRTEGGEAALDRPAGAIAALHEQLVRRVRDSLVACGALYSAGDGRCADGSDAGWGGDGARARLERSVRVRGWSEDCSGIAAGGLARLHHRPPCPPFERPLKLKRCAGAVTAGSSNVHLKFLSVKCCAEVYNQSCKQ